MSVQSVALSIEGMSCAACQNRVRRALEQVQGVEQVQVSLMQNSAYVLFDDAECTLDALQRSVRAAGYKAFVSLRAAHERQNLSWQRQALLATAILTAALLALAMLPMTGWDPGLPGRSAAWAQAILCLGIMALQYHFFTAGIKALFSSAPNMYSLVAVGAGTAFAYSVYGLLGLPPGCTLGELHHHGLYFESAGAILCFVGLSKYIEARLRHRTSEALTRLMQLSPERARVRRGGEELEIPAAQVQSGDIVLLRAGDSLCCDGMVVAGDGYFDQSPITGEPYAVHRVQGDEVISATILSSGYVEVQPLRTGSDTTFARILELIRNTLANKAPVARLADRIAAVFVPAVLAIALVTLAAHLALGRSLEEALMFAVSVLVVSCPCALGLATPAALVAGLGRAARFGVLFKDVTAIQELAAADTVAFDKTGTLTEGKIQIIKQLDSEPGQEKLHQLVALSLEHLSPHPIGAAFARQYAFKNYELMDIRDFREISGFGVAGFIGEHLYSILNNDGLKTLHPELAAVAGRLAKYPEQGLIVVSLLRNGEYQCSFVLGDQLKNSAADAVRMLINHGLEVYMLTGDNERSARFIAGRIPALDYDHCRTRLLPADKARIITELAAAGARVCMVGDGINDAPAFSAAQVAVSLSGASDIALASCQVVLLKPHLYGVVHAVVLARKIMRNIRENLFWAFIYNLIAIPVACGLFASQGLVLSPMLAALLMSLSSVCVVANAGRLTLSRRENRGFMVRNGEELPQEKQEVRMLKTIFIEGMSCSHCANAVLQALRSLPECSGVVVDLEKQKATLHCPQDQDDAVLRGAVEDLGYRVVRIETAPAEDPAEVRPSAP